MAALSPADRAAALVIATQMLALSSRAYSPLVGDDPEAAAPGDTAAALEALIDSRDTLGQVARWTGPTEAVLRQQAATDIVIAAIGFPRVPQAYRPLLAAWRELWAARGHLRDGIARLRAWEAETSVDAVPRLGDGRSPTDGELTTAALRLPGFFRRPAAAA